METSEHVADIKKHLQGGTILLVEPSEGHPSFIHQTLRELTQERECAVISPGCGYEEFISHAAGYGVRTERLTYFDCITPRLKHLRNDRVLYVPSAGAFTQMTLGLNSWLRLGTKQILVVDGLTEFLHHAEPPVVVGFLNSILNAARGRLADSIIIMKEHDDMLHDELLQMSDRLIRC